MFCACKNKNKKEKKKGGGVFSRFVFFYTGMQRERRLDPLQQLSCFRMRRFIKIHKSKDYEEHGACVGDCSGNRVRNMFWPHHEKKIGDHRIDIPVLTEILLARYLPPITATNVQMEWPTTTPSVTQ